MRFLKRTSLIPRSTSINTRVKKAKRKLLVEQLEARRLLAGMYISEIQSNPLFGNADTDQYVELRGTPNATIPTGTYFVAIEGWGAVPGGPGYLHSMIDLSNLTFGANGFLTVTQFGNPYQIDPQSARLVSTSTAFSGLPDGRWSDASTISDRFSHVASASLNFMLIVTPDKPVPGVDYDVEDDGQLDSSTTSSWTILDSVAMMGYTPTPGWSYSGITFSSLTTNHRVPAGTVSIVQEGVGYVARIGSSTGYSADDWVGGTSIEDKINLNSKYRFTYGTFGDPRPLVYSGRATNDIGTYNFGGGFLGTAAIDTDRDGVITKSDTPLAGVTLFADRNDNGIRDTTTVDVISAQQTLGAELANTFPNATLTVADSNNKNIGFAVRTAQTTDNGSNTIRVLSSEGIPWFDTGSRLKVMFYREAQSVSIEAIAAETLKVSYGRIDLYDKNNNLLTSKSTSPLAGTSREVISINRPTADIKYAIIYTDTTLANTSPFGKFDKLRYSYPEFQTATGADGSFRLEELPVGSYRLTVGSYPGNLIPITAGSSSPLNVTKSEHLTDLVFGYKQNLPPEIQSTQFNVAENPATNAVVATVLATDPDAGQTLTYRFTSNSGPFSIDPLTGEIRYNGSAPWDYETTKELNVEVEVRDSLPIPGVTRKVIKLVNLDKNEVPTLKPATFTIDENAAVGTVVGTVVATDPDAGVNGELVYQLGVGAPVGVFSINETTGQIKVASSAGLDYETRSTLIVPIVVRDKGTPPLSATGNVTVNLRDINEPPTNITFTDLVSVPESASAVLPIRIATVNVIDDALGTNVLSLSGPDASNFSLLGNVLRFQSVTPLDFETRPTYTVIVSADDASIGSGPDVSATFVLSILDVNEKPTGVLFRDVLNPVPETTPVSTPIRIANLVAQDDAIGDNSFSIGLGLDSSFFSIVNNELRFRSSTPLDYETKTSYQVLVQVDDPAFPGFPDASTTFTLSIGDVNEAPTDLKLNGAVTSISETNGVSPGQVVANIEVVDDSTGNNILSLEGPDASSFEIVNTQLRLKAGSPLNFEVKPFYDVTVRVTDPSLDGSPTLARNLRVNIANRPEVIGITDLAGNPLGERVNGIRLAFDSELGTVASDAISIVKRDVGFVPVPYTATRSLVNGKTVIDLTFKGTLVDAQGYLIDGGYEVFVNGAKVVVAGASTTGLSYNSGLISVLNPAPPAEVQISGKTLLLTGQAGSYQVVVSGLANPPQVIQYEVDFQSDGIVDRNLSGGTSLSIPSVSYAAPGSYTMKVVAKSGSQILGSSSFAIDVSPKTSSNENWVSAMDTDRDSTVSPLDVLIVINRINTGNGSYSFDYDVDRDGNISPLDVLIVINYLNTPLSGRTDPIGNLVMAESGGNAGITADRTVTGKILNGNRTLFASLNGGDRLDASEYVAADGTFKLTDQAITELFGIIPDGPQLLSLSTRSGSNFSASMDKRFLNLTDYMDPFNLVALVSKGGQLRAAWTSAAPGVRYNVLLGPTNGTLAKVRSNLADTSVQLQVASGMYDIQIEAVDAAGNRRLSDKQTIQV